jgi:sensor histidine kinase YesM
VLREQENRQLSAEKQIAEIRLRRLQAQIEPHFLFNMLSNIHGLIELDPQRASHALESFSDYLLKPVSLGRLKKQFYD